MLSDPLKPQDKATAGRRRIRPKTEGGRAASKAGLPLQELVRTRWRSGEFHLPDPQGKLLTSIAQAADPARPTAYHARWGHCLKSVTSLRSGRFHDRVRPRRPRASFTTSQAIRVTEGTVTDQQAASVAAARPRSAAEGLAPLLRQGTMRRGPPGPCDARVRPRRHLRAAAVRRVQPAGRELVEHMRRSCTKIWAKEEREREGASELPVTPRFRTRAPGRHKGVSAQRDAGKQKCVHLSHSCA